MGKLITILGGCLVVAGGVSYGLYAYSDCDGSGPTCPGHVAVSAECCEEAATPYQVGTSAGDEGCPLAAAARATCPSSTSASAEGESCCPLAGAQPVAASGAGLQAVGGAALAAGGK